MSPVDGDLSTEGARLWACSPAIGCLELRRKSYRRLDRGPGSADRHVCVQTCDRSSEVDASRFRNVECISDPALLFIWLLSAAVSLIDQRSFWRRYHG